MKLSKDQIQKLADFAYSVRKSTLEMVASSGWGHIGGSFSLAEILACLYGGAARISPQNCDSEDRDRIILSKAHCSPALYGALAEAKFFPKEKIYSYCRLGGLDGHTHVGEVPGIEYSGGSLGTGLSVCVGKAWSLRKKELYQPRVYCILGDGELNEGQIWEAAISAAHFQLDNLVVIVDYNKTEAKGRMHQMMAIEPLADKWKSFGWETIEVDGHDIPALHQALHQSRYVRCTGKPICIIAHTVKGRGIEECEFNYKWHTHAPKFETAHKFHQDLIKTGSLLDGDVKGIDRSSDKLDLRGPEPKDRGMEEILLEEKVS